MRLLLVDDDPSCRFLLSSFLDEEGHEVREAETIAQALACITDFSPELAFLDCNLPDGSGLELAATLRSRHPGCTLVLLTGNREEEVVGDVSAIDHFLTKPFSLSKIRALLGDDLPA